MAIKIYTISRKALKKKVSLKECFVYQEGQVPEVRDVFYLAEALKKMLNQ